MPQLPVVYLEKIQLLPGTAIRLVLHGGPLRSAVEEALERPDHHLAVFGRRLPGAGEPGPEDLFAVGVQACVEREPPDDGQCRTVLRGLERVRLLGCQGGKADVEVLPAAEGGSEELEALRLELLEVGQRLALLTGRTLGAQELSQCEPLTLAYQLAATFDFDLSRCQPLLEAGSSEEALRLVLTHLSHDHRVKKLQQKLDREARADLDREERRAFLASEMRVIQRELGDDEDEGAELERLRERLEEAELAPSVRREAERQLKALRRLTRSASEYAPTLSHLELILDLPWQRMTQDRHDLARARALLDAGHHGLSEVKERVLEHLAVMQLNPEARAPIVCFTGPPGTGKTSLGRSIAEALGRTFDSLSLGGMHDEGELRGHRRTYVAAMPGRVLTALRRAGARNPVLMLDEIDKLGAPGHQGDPAAALMEILDPRENVAFRDNYLDLPFDLSRVFFITTANNLEGIPRPLQDRMEVISFSGYTVREKLEIARAHLWPLQLREAGLRPEQVELPDESLTWIIDRHTCEAGVRQLERALARMARQLALRIAERGETGPFRLEGDQLRGLLGREPYRPAQARLASPPGVAAGVGWTEAGGDVLYVEAVVLPGPAGLTLTGQLGEVLQESAQTALSLLAARGLGGSRRSRTVHIHVPAGAIRKDGPSAGAPLVVALASALTGRPVRPDTAMTGEITLSGLVLPVGGLRNKALATLRAGLRRLVLPAGNQADLDEIPSEVRDELELVLVADVDALLAAVL